MQVQASAVRCSSSSGWRGLPSSPGRSCALRCHVCVVSVRQRARPLLHPGLAGPARTCKENTHSTGPLTSHTSPTLTHKLEGAVVVLLLDDWSGFGLLLLLGRRPIDVGGSSCGPEIPRPADGLQHCSHGGAAGSQINCARNGFLITCAVQCSPATRCAVDVRL